MGFRYAGKTYDLKFTAPELAGLEVAMRSVTVGEWGEMMAPAPPDPAERAKANRKILELFASRIVSWNLEDAAGVPVPHDAGAIAGQDRALVAEVITAWQLALVGVDPTSDGESPSGAETIPRMTAEDLEALAATSAPEPSSPGNSPTTA